MNRNRVVTVTLAAAAACLPFSAQADVLEVGPHGAAWITISGGAATIQSTPEPAKGPDIPAAALADPAEAAASVPSAYAAKVQELAARFDLSPALIEALVWQESRWRAGARSPVGARGLAQLMPGTAAELGVDPDDPFANLEGGARYLRQMLDRFNGDVEKALAAYNAGPGRVERAGGVPPIRETRTYVAAVMGRLSDHVRR